MSEPIKNRYDFVYYFDVECGNPNGDPDAGNMPRTDPETGRGLVTDVCLKRKIRNYVETVREGEPGYEIYIKAGVPLEVSNTRALSRVGIEPGATKDAIKDLKKADPMLDVHVRDAMCETYYDVRAFGAVMTTFTKNGLNCGQVRGPVQLAFAKSVDEVVPQEISVTRCVVSTKKEAEDKQSTMGTKWIVPYALYRCEGFISANLARKTTGFSEDDLELFWEALENMFDLDRAAGRGLMAPRSLIIFKHDSELGCAPAHKLFDAVTIVDKGVLHPRSFADYGGVVIDGNRIPSNIEVIRRI